MPARLLEQEAVELMRTAGFEVLEAYVNTKTPWKSKHLKCGRTVSPTLNSIRNGQGGCPFCAGLKIDPIEAYELFISKGLKPIEPYQGNKHPWLSIHIPCGREVSPTYNLIQRGQSGGCKFCSDTYVDPRDAYQLFLARDLIPLEPYPGSAKPWKSIHTICGSSVSPRYAHIRDGRKGCPVCSKRIPISQERALAFFKSKGLIPQEPFQGPHHPWKSIHIDCGKEVSPRWANVQQGANGCKFCSGKKIDETDAERYMHEIGVKPIVPFPGGDKPWKSIHLTCGKTIQPRYAALVKGQGPCRYCAGNAVDPEDATRAFVETGLQPLEPFPGASVPWKSKHLVCGNEVQPRYSYVRTGGIGCTYCAGLVPVSAESAIKLFVERGFKPISKFESIKIPLISIHLVCGNEVSPTYSSLKRGGGCKYCSIGGISLKAPAFLYLMTNESLNAHKIGIGGFESTVNRIAQHKKHGWHLYRSVDFNTAESAYEIEQITLDWLRNELGLGQYLISEQMPQGGHTETVDASEIDLETIWDGVLKFISLNKEYQ